MRLSEDSGAIAGGVEPSHGSFNDSTDNLCHGSFNDSTDNLKDQIKIKISERFMQSVDQDQ